MTPEGRKRLEAYRREVEEGQLELPWGGRSPRELTDAYKRFSLSARDDAEVIWDDRLLEEQHRRFRHGS